jgi:hypothetical protein
MLLGKDFSRVSSVGHWRAKVLRSTVWSSTASRTFVSRPEYARLGHNWTLAEA